MWQCWGHGQPEVHSVLKQMNSTRDAKLGHEIVDDAEETDLRKKALINELLHTRSTKGCPLGVNLQV